MTDFGGTYTTGTISVTNGTTTVTGTGTFWSPIAEQGDWLYCDGSVGLVASVTDNTHLELELPWAGTNQSTQEYRLIKMSWLRYEPAITQAKVRALLAFFDGVGLFYFVSGDSPDPSLGDDGQFALKVNSGPWKVWLKVAGEWVFQGTPVGTNWRGVWSNSTAYVVNDLVQRNGSTYISIQDGTGQDPATATAYWELSAAKGDTGNTGATGPIAWLAPVAWATGQSYVAGPPASLVTQGGESYACLIAHTSGTFSTDLAAGKWIKVAAKGSDGGGVASATANGVGIATGATNMTSTAALTDGQIVVGQSGSAPLPKAVSGDATLAKTGAVAVVKVQGLAFQPTTYTHGQVPTWNAANNQFQPGAGGTRTINSQTGTTYTFVIGDNGSICRFSNASAVTVTVPPNSSVAFPVGTQIDVSQAGAGKVTFAQGAGVTINSLNSNKALAGQYAGGTLVKTATDTWTLFGSLIA